MYALSEPSSVIPAAPVAAPGPVRHVRPAGRRTTSGRVVARTTPRRLDAAVYRRRRLLAAVAMTAVIGIVVAVAAGAADQALGERALALVVFGAWLRACVAFARWDRRPARSRAESRVSCLALDSAPAR